MQSLVDAVAALAAARHLEDVTRIVRTSARTLTGADGVTFVLREGSDCFYADEDAIAPLWKGKRFPMETCISGWAMLNRESVIIKDIYTDARIPHDAYRPTFVRSLIMVPVGDDEPVAAIGAYWAEQHEASVAERQVLQALANAAALALSNIHLNARLERTLESEREARRSAEKANRVKDDFLATISHELRTPLHVIQNWIWQLKHMPENERPFKKALEIIDRNTEVQARLIEDLLDISQSSNGKLQVQPQLVDLRQACEAALEVCELSARAKKIRLEFVRSAAPQVWGDPDRLRQILWNVLANAIKFTPDNGRVRLLLSRGPRHACIAIEDSGIGVEPQFLPHMFDRFTQAEPTATRRFGGLGIGLSIVKELMTLHGGTVRAESAGQYQGTKVTLEFPIPTLLTQPETWRAAATTGTRSPRLTGLTILLVDDDTDALTLLENVLVHHGASVLRASSAIQALALFEQHAPGVMIADLSMPDRDGIELIKAIRELNGPSSHVPAVVLSAHMEAERGAAAHAAGFQLYIEKPVKPDAFVGQIASLAGLH